MCYSVPPPPVSVWSLGVVCTCTVGKGMGGGFESWVDTSYAYDTRDMRLLPARSSTKHPTLEGLCSKSVPVDPSLRLSERWIGTL